MQLQFLQRDSQSLCSLSVQPSPRCGSDDQHAWQLSLELVDGMAVVRVDTMLWQADLKPTTHHRVLEPHKQTMPADDNHIAF